METSTYTAAGVNRRVGGVVLATVIALAVIGYGVGLRAGVPDAGLPARDALLRGQAQGGTRAADDVIPAMTYAEVGAGGLREALPGQGWGEMVAFLRSEPGKPVIDPETRRQSLGMRSERRAYNGAPPMIPHDARSLDDRSCLVCHGQALEIGNRMARALPHPPLTSCTQCHAPAAPAFLQAVRGGVLAPSDWVGIAAPSEGERALPGAPPAVPHSLHMRDNCLACHGAQGWPGMQTSHPERRSCLQCHAPTQDRAHPGRTLGLPFFLPAPIVGAK